MSKISKVVPKKAAAADSSLKSERAIKKVYDVRYNRLTMKLEYRLKREGQKHRVWVMRECIDKTADIRKIKSFNGKNKQKVAECTELLVDALKWLEDWSKVSLAPDHSFWNGYEKTFLIEKVLDVRFKESTRKLEYKVKFFGKSQAVWKWRELTDTKPDIEKINIFNEEHKEKVEQCTKELVDALAQMEDWDQILLTPAHTYFDGVETTFLVKRVSNIRLEGTEVLLTVHWKGFDKPSEQPFKDLGKEHVAFLAYREKNKQKVERLFREAHRKKYYIKAEVKKSSRDTEESSSGVDETNSSVPSTHRSRDFLKRSRTSDANASVDAAVLMASATVPLTSRSGRIPSNATDEEADMATDTPADKITAINKIKKNMPEFSCHCFKPPSVKKESSRVGQQNPRVQSSSSRKTQCKKIDGECQCTCIEMQRSAWIARKSNEVRLRCANAVTHLKKKNMPHDRDSVLRAAPQLQLLTSNSQDDEYGGSSITRRPSGTSVISENNEAEEAVLQLATSNSLQESYSSTDMFTNCMDQDGNGTSPNLTEDLDVSHQDDRGLLPNEVVSTLKPREVIAESHEMEDPKDIANREDEKLHGFSTSSGLANFIMDKNPEAEHEETNTSCSSAGPSRHNHGSDSQKRDSQPSSSSAFPAAIHTSLREASTPRLSIGFRRHQDLSASGTDSGSINAFWRNRENSGGSASHMTSSNRIPGLGDGLSDYSSTSTPFTPRLEAAGKQHPEPVVPVSNEPVDEQARLRERIAQRNAKLEEEKLARRREADRRARERLREFEKLPLIQTVNLMDIGKQHQVQPRVVEEQAPWRLEDFSLESILDHRTAAGKFVESSVEVRREAVLKLMNEAKNLIDRYPAFKRTGSASIQSLVAFMQEIRPLDCGLEAIRNQVEAGHLPNIAHLAVAIGDVQLVDIVRSLPGATDFWGNASMLREAFDCRDVDMFRHLYFKETTDFGFTHIRMPFLFRITDEVKVEYEAFLLAVLFG